MIDKSSSMEFQIDLRNPERASGAINSHLVTTSDWAFKDIAAFNEGSKFRVVVKHKEGEKSVATERSFRLVLESEKKFPY